MTSNPTHPSPSRSRDRVRREAKALLKQIHAGDGSALARYHAVWVGTEASSHATLQRVQHVLAQEAGFACWRDLPQPDRADAMDLVLIAALDGSDSTLLAGPPLTIVVGIAGCGKTVAIAGLAVAACRRGRPVCWVSPDGNPGHRPGWGFARGLLLQETAPWSEFILQRRPPFDDHHAILAEIERAIPQQGPRGLVIIDEIRSCAPIIPAALATLRRRADVILTAQVITDLFDLDLVDLVKDVPLQVARMQSPPRDRERLGAWLGFPLPAGITPEFPSRPGEMQVLTRSTRSSRCLAVKLTAAGRFIIGTSYAEECVRLKAMRTYPHTTPADLVRRHLGDGSTLA